MSTLSWRFTGDRLAPVRPWRQPGGKPALPVVGVVRPPVGVRRLSAPLDEGGVEIVEDAR